MKLSGKLRTMNDAMNAKSPTLATFKREKGRKFTEGMIILWLMYLNDILNLKRPLTEDQIELCAVNIIDEFGSLKMSDLTLLFKRILSGTYGEFYESLNIAKVLTFFREYQNERFELAEQESMRAHNDFKSDDTFNYSRDIRRIMTMGAKGFNSSKKK